MIDSPRNELAGIVDDIDALDASAGNFPGIETPAEGPTIPRRIVLTSDGELDSLPTPEWLIDGVLPVRGLGLLFGASETFKSFIALDAAYHIETGRPWQGRPVTQATVVYICGEGFFGLKKRRDAWKQYYDTPGMPGIRYLRHGIDVQRGSRDLIELRSAIHEALGDRVGIIVLDTLNRNFVGNENAPDAMSDYLKGCAELQQAFGASVLSIHHTGHVEAERSRGHSSLRAALDLEMRCDRDGDRVTITCTKMKDAAHFAPIKFDMVPIADSLVPKGVGTVDVKLTPARRTALAVLPTEGGLARGAWQTASDLKPGTFRHVLEWCERMGYARQQHGGKYIKTASASLVELP